MKTLQRFFSRGAFAAATTASGLSSLLLLLNGASADTKWHGQTPHTIMRSCRDFKHNSVDMSGTIEFFHPIVCGSPQVPVRREVRVRGWWDAVTVYS